jgi:hypothetical protein
VFGLDRFSSAEGLKAIVIYRDPRDIVRSAIRMSQTAWRGQPASESYNTAEKVAHSWLNAVDRMENNRSWIHPVRYEGLVEDPAFEFAGLAEYLGVELDGFRFDRVDNNRVGKYRGALTSEQIDQILNIAGSKMRILSYL